MRDRLFTRLEACLVVIYKAALKHYNINRMLNNTYANLLRTMKDMKTALQWERMLFASTAKQTRVTQ